MKKALQKSDFLFCSILIVYSIVFLFFHAPFEWYDGDSSDYIGTAQSVITKHSYTFNFAPQTKFPPAYPLFLAQLSAISKNGFDTNDIFVSCTALLGLVGVVATYVLMRKKSPMVALCIVIRKYPYFFPTDDERISCLLKTKKVPLGLVNSGNKYRIYKVNQKNHTINTGY